MAPPARAEAIPPAISSIINHLFFFKQKTAYEMRISDWSSDVCSSYLGTAALRNAMTVLSDLDGDWRKPLPADVPLGHVERRWHRHVVVAGKIDRTHWEMATYGALANALASGDIWVPRSRLHRRSEEHTSELQSLMRISYAVFCLKKIKS